MDTLTQQHEEQPITTSRDDDPLVLRAAAIAIQVLAEDDEGCWQEIEVVHWPVTATGERAASSTLRLSRGDGEVVVAGHFPTHQPDDGTCTVVYPMTSSEDNTPACMGSCGADIYAGCILVEHGHGKRGPSTYTCECP